MYKVNLGRVRPSFAPDDGGTGGGSTTTTTVDTSTQTTVAPWYATSVTDPEVLGHWQNRGWDKLSAAEIAINATKAHREAEKFIGAPANELARLPKADSDPATVQAFWNRLGAPDSKDGYDLTSVKFADGTPLDDAFVAAFRETAANLHLPKDAATQVAQSFVKFMEQAEASEGAEKAAALATERANLEKNWGANKDANMLVARNAARALGIDPETVQALEAQVGYAKVMEMFRTIGSKIGEDKFVTGDNPAGPGVMTRDQAVAQKGDLMKDGEWVKRYMAGGVAELRQMTALNTLIVGDDTEYSRGR